MEEMKTDDAADAEDGGVGDVKMDLPQGLGGDNQYDDMAKDSVAKANSDSPAKADSPLSSSSVASGGLKAGSSKSPVSFTFHFN